MSKTNLMPKPNTKEMLRQIQILEVDVDSLARERENLFQELGLMEQRVKTLEARLDFLVAQFPEWRETK